MVSGGVTEIIWHFAGYFRHIEEVIKARLNYEDGSLVVRPDDYAAKQINYTSSPDFDEIDTAKIGPPQEVLLAPTMFFRSLLAVPKDAGDDSIADFGLKSPGKFLPVSAGGVAGGGGSIAQAAIQKKITLTYVDDDEQQLLQADQTNAMQDDDQMLVVPGSNVAALRTIDVDAKLEKLLDDSIDEVPEDLTLREHRTDAAIEFVTTRDARIDADGGGETEHLVEAGVYLDGVRQDEPLPDRPVAEEVPPLDPAAKGQWAMLGDNQSTNAALIVDLKEACNTMIVAGDFFKTNAIVQMNSFVDSDRIAIAGAPGIPAISGGANTAENIASFEQQPGVFAELPDYFSGFQWRISVVSGNFYDVNIVTQSNWISDNDIAVQNTSNTHFEATLGANEQLNLVQIFDGEVKYDLIIVCGNYHGANFIFQHNILIDSDLVKIANQDSQGAASSEAATGANTLLNSADILNYGDDTFLALSSGATDLLTALASQPDALDLPFGSLIPGNGSNVLNVLYVTGDYYDINAIWQVNVVADADIAIQLTGAHPSEDEFTQSVSSGDNDLTNDAAIVDVGGTSSLVGGDVYQELILVQAELVSEDADQVVYGNPDVLISEIVAFTGPPEDEVQNGDVTITKIIIPQDDTIGSVLS